MINVLLETGFTPYISQIYSGFIFASLIMVMTMVFQVYLTEYLNENQAIITENSVEGLVDGLMIHLEGNKSFEEFDFNYYKEKSKQEFINVFK